MTSFFQSVFSQSTNYVGSTCADYVSVNALTGTATVMFNNGGIYTYKGVSRRAILLFMADSARSFGKFVNNVLSASRVEVIAK